MSDHVDRKEIRSGCEAACRISSKQAAGFLGCSLALQSAPTENQGPLARLTHCILYFVSEATTRQGLMHRVFPSGPFVTMRGFKHRSMNDIHCQA